MIRSFSVLIAALISVSAYATPKLGDFASFDATLMINGQQMQGSVQQEIVQHDTNSNQFLERQTVSMPGQPTEVSDEWKSAEEYLDDATIDAILANCSQIGGTPQNVPTRAGNFNTCALPFDNEDSQGLAYVAKVPFGVARIDTVMKENNLTVIMVLNSYR